MAKPVMPEVLDATFIAEVRDAGGLPPLGAPEVAIAGRSNVGKSTLLNRLAGRHALARVSKTPGRTRGVLFYDLKLRLPGDEARIPLRLVDLPGYGYAQVSRDERNAWQHLVEGYVKARSSLRLFLVLLDVRRELGAEEKQLVEWLNIERVPHHLVITKLDKLGAAEKGGAARRLRESLGSSAASVSLVSGETGEGIEQLWRTIIGAAGLKNDPGAPAL
jgi:GTP-binding protein